ncbi:hypothetical protein MPH_06534 [Macrophomina phaseolina MS6]|uniref:DUF7907 domain-containing protein n=1 Tax=Macrophomina phaseolina (strain MS6) TaxID=1126212 RepID=K2R1W5_MACPH|nr:hypothetical protein MPH_06534 [Macrophomina phaseolina MS6]
MGVSQITALTLGLLAVIPPAFASGTSLHYRLRARVTGPRDEKTPPVDGWALQVQRLPVNTHAVPADWMWGVLYNETYQPSRGGDLFYTQPASDGSSHVRTDAPNAEGDVTPFGFSVGEPFSGYDLVSDQMVAVRSNRDETVTDIGVAGDGVPLLQKPGYSDATFVACNELSQEYVQVYWANIAFSGTDPIYTQDWRNCTEIQLVPECASDGPKYEDLQESSCVADIATVL